MSYTREQVVALVQSEFAAGQVLSIIDLLDRYGTEGHEHERVRAQLAILKLSAGDERKLRHFVEAAKRDYRDVLYWADTPAASTEESPLLAILRKEWGWALPEPKRVAALSPFGNLLVESLDGGLWRVCPEDLTMSKVAESATGVERLLADPEFRTDWHVEEWVVAADSALGPLREGQCYGFRIWPVLGGQYSVDNMVIKSLAEWIAASGAVGRQVSELPDGAQITLDTRPEVAE